MSVLDVDAPAVVLGSAQPDGLVDRSAARRAGLSVVRRRSGGGAVLVEPGGSTWIDLQIPVGDPLWDDDVGRASHWVGDAWTLALGPIAGVPPLVVHRGAMVRTEWSRLVCFAGTGPGEVLVDRPDGATAKVVGISQRRTRAGARFQCVIHHHWRPRRLLDVLAIAADARDRAVITLAGAALEVDRPTGLVSAALIEALPTA